MRTFPDYLAEIADIARDSEAGILPDSTLDLQVACVAATYGVDAADVEADVTTVVRECTASPEYRAAIAELADDCESCGFPSYELENQAAAIASRFGVDDRAVQADVSAAQDRLVSARAA